MKTASTLHKTMHPLLIIALTLSLAGVACEPAEAPEEEPVSSIADEPLAGSWTLVSYRNEGVEMRAPALDGLMVVAGGHFSRSYIRRASRETAVAAADKLPTAPRLPPFMANSGSYRTDGDNIELHVQHADYPALRGVVFRETFELSDHGKTLTLQGAEGESDFEEVWQRLPAHKD